MPRRRPSPIPTRMATLCTIAWKVSTLSRLKRMMTIGVEARNAHRLYLIIHSPAISNSYRGFPRNDTSSIHFIHEQACCLVRHQGRGTGPGVGYVGCKSPFMKRFRNAPSATLLVCRSPARSSSSCVPGKRDAYAREETNALDYQKAGEAFLIPDTEREK